jgi:radical SAM protein with 4Fe4S-binding SPASM domain
MKWNKIEVDSHKLLYHPERVAEWKRGEDPFPIYLEFGLTNNCNLKCTFCALDFLDKSKIAYLDRNMMLNTLKDMAEHGVRSVMYAGEGESTVHPNFVEFVTEAKRLGMDVAVTTNGIALTKDKLKEVLPALSWVRFSFSAATPENYVKIHGVSNLKLFDTVLQNIHDAVKIKKANKLAVKIGVQFLLLPGNMHEAVSMAKICKEAGIDNLQIKPYSQHPDSINRQDIDYSKYENLEKDLAAYNSDTFQVIYRSQTMARIAEKGDYKNCEGLNFFALIDASGNILPCNLFYQKEDFYYGNLYKNSFSEIWRSQRRKKVLAKLRKKGCEGCREGCRLDPVNRYLDRLTYPHPHDNFI